MRSPGFNVKAQKWRYTVSSSTPVVAVVMDGELDPNAAKAEEDVTISSPQQPSTETGEALSLEDNDDDVVLVEEEEAVAPPSQDRTSPEPAVDPSATATPSQAPSPSVSSNTTRLPAASPAEPIIIDDEDDSEHKDTSANKTTPGGSLASHSPAALTEPDSEIKIASVTTLGSREHRENGSPQMEEGQADINLMITSVTSLQEGGTSLEAAGEDHTEENGLQITNAFSLNAETPSGRTSTPFNPGRGIGPTDQLVQNGDTGAHNNRTDSWISQSASVPRNQKHSGVDASSKPQGQSSSGSQPRTVKVTCANCKKPLKKGQTAYQRKGSTHLFCSTTCLSAFSHKPTPKKSCTMCKKDITNMKGTIVAQVDSSESFHEFCSTGCLGAYENKQHPPKSGVKTKCTVCGKLTEIRHEVSFKTVTHKICSDACFNVYRRANGLIMNCCEQCGDYLPSRASANHSLLVDGQQKRFCCHNCIRDFKQAHNKLASCVTCKTLIKTGEVLHSIGASGTMGSYCSLSCMNKGKLATASFQNSEPTCHFCKKNALPQYQATLPEGNVLNFCSSQCVTKFQNATLQTTANGQAALSTDDSVQLKCNYCRGAFSLKPEILDWDEKVYQFCSKTCCDDYKKLHCIVTFCEYCQEEKTLHETVKFSGIKRPFCSEGCKLLFKQDFIKRLGLKCVSCNHCSQLCKRGVTRQLGGMTRDFCSEACAKKFHDWYYKAARCDCCKVQGNLMESVMWRSEMKHFCDQQCLLKFYCQQNEPIMVTQKGPENSVGAQGPKLGLVNPSAVAIPAGGLVRDVKNKAVLCKPLTLTKATYCKPHMQSKPLQTEVDDGVKREYVPVPIPVPVFIPMPMNMYTQITPTPVSLPVPVPVPVFLPTTLQGAEQIIQTINELKTKVATDPQRADLLASLKHRPELKPVKIQQEQSEDESSSSSETNSEDSKETEDKYEPELDLEADFPPALDLATDERMEDSTVAIAPAVKPKQEDSESPPRPQPRKQGNKRRAVEERSEQAMSFSRSSGQRSNGLPLKSRYGINAWKRWALSSPDKSDDTNVKNGSKSVSRDRAHSNLLVLSSEELNLALCGFVQEVCRPNGEHYSPDSVLYLCLGIQKHLHDKGRKDNLFADPCYHQFMEELNKILKNWKPSMLPNGSAWSRVEEQSLWSSQQLGDHSPASLLHSLVYLNTKYFGLRCVEQHLRLSFANVYSPDMVHPTTYKTSGCIRVPSISQDLQVQPEIRRRKRKLEDGDEDDDSGSYPLTQHERHLYTLYRDKCPASVRDSADVLYLQPEPVGSPDGQWYSSTPLQTPALESLLTRVLMVRDVYLEKSEEKHKEQEDRAQQAEGEKQLLD